jgi:hypothetical protein
MLIRDIARKKYYLRIIKRSDRGKNENARLKAGKRKPAPCEVCESCAGCRQMNENQGAYRPEEKI